MAWKGTLPRNVDEACKIGAIILLTPALVLIIIGVTEFFRGKEWHLVAENAGEEASIMHALVIPAVLIGLAGFMFFGPRQIAKYFAMPIALMGSTLTCAINIAANDWTAGGVIFYALPIIYGGYVIRTVGSYVILAWTSGCVLVHFYYLTTGIELLTNAPAVLLALTIVSLTLTRSRTAQSKTLSAVRSRADMDMLTKLNTRAVLDERLNERLLDGDQCQETTLLIVDIDHFKSVNDTHGHPVGDQALQHVAKILRAQTRTDDIACRLGGDELAMLMANCSRPVAYSRAAEIVAQVNSTPLVLADGTTVEMTVSIGVAQAPFDAIRAEALYSAADTGLYEAKRTGRNRAALAISGNDLGS